MRRLLSARSYMGSTAVSLDLFCATLFHFTPLLFHCKLKIYFFNESFQP